MTAERDDEDASDCDGSELVVAGEGDGVVLVIVGGEEGVLLLPPFAAVALTLRLTPTLPQSCCANAMTSADGKEELG